MNKSLKYYFIIMNVLYTTALVLSFTSWFKPVCLETRLYPVLFTFLTTLYLVNFLYSTYITRKHFFLKEVNLKAANTLGKGKKDQEVREALIKEKLGTDECSIMLFKEQMSKYDKYSLLVCIWNIGIQVMAYVVKHDDTFLGCNDN